MEVILLIKKKKWRESFPETCYKLEYQEIVKRYEREVLSIAHTHAIFQGQPYLRRSTFFSPALHANRARMMATTNTIQRNGIAA